jgi:hypothetical protein
MIRGDPSVIKEMYMKYIRTFEEEIPNILPHQSQTPNACFSKNV